MEKFRKEESIRQLADKNKKLINLSIIGIFIILVISGLMFLKIKSADNPSSQNQLILKIDEILSSDWVKGNKESKIILIEYSDFQCPACGIYYPIVNKLAEEFGDKIAIIYRHFPLKSIHRNAEAAALAAEAAGRQGKFWEMHNALFDNQKEWSDEINSGEYFVKYAGGLPVGQTGVNIDINKFKADLSLQEVKNKVKNDLVGAEKNNLNSTPTFFLNGKKIQPRSYEEFKQIILDEIKKNQKNEQ